MGQDQSEHTGHGSPEPIAIVDMALRFPGGNDTLEGFEEFLRAGGDGVGPLPTERWGSGQGSLEGITAVAGGFLEQVDQFDCGFFGIPPKQAAYIDPQQRLLLETSWAALEHARLDPSDLRGCSGGVYIGGSPLDFTLDSAALSEDSVEGTLATGTGAYSLSGRLSYFLGWRGPSLTADTACASSLTALHLAVEGLRAGETDLALCGGVNALHSRRSYVILSKAQMLAPDGRCKPFDDAADGYGRAEGCGVVVLKRLSDAQRDADTVLAVVRGTAIGQDGESAGLSAPNGVAQERVIRAALKRAGLRPGDIQYVEAHGTGTPLGDPIEVSSISAALSEGRDPSDPVLIGSVKANIGHMEAAAGAGSIAKVVLQLRAKTIFPHRVTTLSKKIPWDTYPVAIPQILQPWKAPVRRAVVNGFGVAGAIGVAVLEEAPPVETPEERWTDASAGLDVLTISAKSPTALRLQAKALQEYILASPNTDISDVCLARSARSHFRYRAAVAVGSAQDALNFLGAIQSAADRAPKEVRRTALMFTGSGAQHVGMGRELYDRFPTFREHVDECDKLFSAHLDRSIRGVMLGAARGADELITGTRLGHAALFTLEYSLARLLQSWGIKPTALIGHSVGEIVAATFAGVFSLSDGIRLLDSRARLIETVRTLGAMAAVAADETTVREALEREPQVSLAAINSPRQCVISGPTQGINNAVKSLRAQGYSATYLNVRSAFHSTLMNEIADDFLHVLRNLTYHDAQLPLVSNLTGTFAKPGELQQPEYWLRHLLEPVNFMKSIESIGARGSHAFIEVGPLPHLTALARQCPNSDKHVWIPCLDGRPAKHPRISTALATMYQAGLPLAWKSINEHRPRSDLGLPTYVFDRKSLRLPQTPTDSRHEVGLLGQQTHASEDGLQITFESIISTTHPPYLADHRLHSRPFLPGSAYLDIALAASDYVHGSFSHPVLELRFLKPLFLSEAGQSLRTRARIYDAGCRLEVSAADGDEEVLLASAVIGRQRQSRPSPDAMHRVGALTRMTEPDIELSSTEIYEAFNTAGLDYGPQFKRATSAAKYNDLAVVEIDSGDVVRQGFLAPQLFDAMTHGLALLANDGIRYVAAGIDAVCVFRKPRAATLKAMTWRTEAKNGIHLSGVLLEDGEVILEMQNMRFVPVPEQPEARPGGACGATEPRKKPQERNTEDQLSQTISENLATIMSIDQPRDIDRYATFSELGVDSLMTVEFAARLEAALARPVDQVAIMSHPTIGALTLYLKTTQGGEVR